MINKKIILKQFLRMGAYARVAVLTRGLELYMDRRPQGRNQGIESLVGLFWAYCAGEPDLDKLAADMTDAWSELKDDQSNLMLILGKVDEVVKTQAFSPPASKGAALNLFELFWGVLLSLSEKGVVIGDLGPVVGFGRLRPWLKFLLGPYHRYSLGRPFAREEILPFIEYHLSPER